MAATARSRPEGDLSWGEVGELALRYGRIPLALLCVEAFYWFLTMPSDTLVPVQLTEAWLWNELTNLIYGEGSAVLSTHNGWMTRIDLQHPSFPGPFDSVGLYVSDECAGVHEMIFVSTLVMMTDGVPQQQKWRAVAVMCGVVYVLNLLRLLVFYPIALNAGHPKYTGMPHAHVAVSRERVHMGLPRRPRGYVARVVREIWRTSAYLRR